MARGAEIKEAQAGDAVRLGQQIATRILERTWPGENR